MGFRIFTFYTRNTPYEQEAKNLEMDCVKLNVDCEIHSTLSSGKWVENTMMKPAQISTALQLFSNTNAIVWIDADARLQAYPVLFDELEEEGIDFSVFQMGSQSRVTSGTIFMRNNSKVREFVKDWEKECTRCPDRLGDQHCLRRLIRSNGYKKYNIKYKPLPYSYCYIFDDSLRKLAPDIPPLTEPPVILHTQASRRYRNKRL